ncbi:MAG: DNA polymerase III subunit beta [Thiotrichaceae bacterium]|nr:DNA polymerase III subunit beta [Thiotrichaceae bacterium]
MYFEIPRKELLPSLKMITSVVEMRQTLPILGNVLVQVENATLKLTATDAEVEIACTLPLEASLDSSNDGETTIPARKLFDICRSLSDGAPIQINNQDAEERAVVRSGKSRFTLSCLPASDFPSRQAIEGVYRFKFSQRTLKELFARTQFAMAQQDVRYYLNGICLDLNNGRLSVVATDGHRLAMGSEPFDLDGHEPIQVIIPRKAVTELTRMLDGADSEVEIALDEHHIQVTLSQSLSLSSKLIDGRFPDYLSVIPHRTERTAVIAADALKQALSRVAILSNEKYKGVRLSLSNNLLKVTARNPEQEEAEEELEIVYEGEEFEIGFNVNYLLDVLSVINAKEVDLRFNDPNSSCLITPHDVESVQYVIMPMRL